MHWSGPTGWIVEQSMLCPASVGAAARGPASTTWPVRGVTDDDGASIPRWVGLCPCRLGVGVGRCGRVGAVPRRGRSAVHPTPGSDAGLLSAVGAAERTRIQRCHRDAVDDAFGWARIRIATARDPDGTVARIAPQRLHTSRVEHADDDGPHRGLHTHLLIAGRMRDGADGPWTVLDLRQVQFVAPAMSARYNSFVTAQARWRDRP